MVLRCSTEQERFPLTPHQGVQTVQLPTLTLSQAVHRWAAELFPLLSLALLEAKVPPAP